VLADEALTSSERAYIVRAVPKRRAEFATARRLARAALGALGVAPVSLVPGPDRAPTWPAGVVGSISHTQDYCAVVVDRASEIRAIGLDVEALRPIEPALLGHIVTPREQRWIDAQPAAERDQWALVFFSAKESYYKCQYPITRRFLDFPAVELELDPAAGRFEAHVRDGSGPPELVRLPGRFLVRAGMVLSGATLVD
jgi:4'-phosphopantetheinyl transferase EntD